MDASVFEKIDATFKDDLRIFCFETHLYVKYKVLDDDDLVLTGIRNSKFFEEFGNSLLGNWETHAKRFRKMLGEDFPRYDQRLDNFATYVMHKTREILNESTFNVAKDLEMVTVFLYELYYYCRCRCTGSFTPDIIEFWCALFLKFFFKRFNNSENVWEVLREAYSSNSKKSKAKACSLDSEESKAKACSSDSRKYKAKTCSSDSKESKAKTCSSDSKESKSKACSSDSRKYKSKTCSSDSKESKVNACLTDSEESKTKAFSPDSEESKTKAFSPDSVDSEAKACYPGTGESKAKACSPDSEEFKAKACSSDSEKSKAKACSPDFRKSKATDELDSSYPKTILIEEKFTGNGLFDYTIEMLSNIENICSLVYVVDTRTMKKIRLHKILHERNDALEFIKETAEPSIDQIIDIFDNDPDLRFRLEEIPEFSSDNDEQQLKKAKRNKRKKGKKKINVYN